MEWFLWVLIAYFSLNIALAPTEVGKRKVVTAGQMGFQILIWLAIIAGLLVAVL